MNENINSKLSLLDFDGKNDLGEVEKRTKEKTEQTAFLKQRVNYSVLETDRGSVNKACLWIISPLKASKWSQITFCILTMPCLASLKDFASILSK